MSKYFSEKWSRLEPYVPGEQPRDTAYVKLNTNESPWAPTLEISEDAIGRMRALNLYPDPTYTELREALAGVLTARSGVAIAPENITVSNGSDEVLSWAFAAWCDEDCPAVFADITYGFYPVFAEQQRVPYVELPLAEDFTIKVADYCTPGRKTIFIANPNAPTGLALPLSAIREILDANPGNVVVVDEAYVDFGGESAVCLVPEYPNLLVTQTFSKSRSFAGGRLGFGVAQTSLMADLETLRNSINPYNVNNATVAWGLAILAREDITVGRCAAIVTERDRLTAELQKRGFEVLPSSTNFVFARHDTVSGETIYRECKAKGVLVRHFARPRIADFNRITVGTFEQTDALMKALDEILEEA
ncbi:MAG: histidinol-phosphate transaminase [Eggerthellaceae bacterium]|nr:histidinol-phosphate transaminase [Eggerthellaceae bacterium]